MGLFDSTKLQVIAKSRDCVSPRSESVLRLLKLLATKRKVMSRCVSLSEFSNLA
jgi:hypothetical protein